MYCLLSVSILIYECVLTVCCLFSWPALLLTGNACRRLGKAKARRWSSAKGDSENWVWGTERVGKVPRQPTWSSDRHGLPLNKRPLLKFGLGHSHGQGGKAEGGGGLRDP